MRKKLQLTTATDEVLLRLTFYRFLLKSGKNRLRGSIGFRMILSILFLCISLTGYSQLPIQNFESGIPSSWSLFNGGVGTGTWATTPNGYLGGNAAFINPSAYDIGAGNSAEYFMVTPNVTIPTKGEIRFYTKRATSGTNDSVDYQIRLSTASQPDINGFNVILKSWNGNDLNDGADNEYEEKVIDIPESLSGLNVYIAFVAVHAQTGATVLGDAWYIDNVRVIEGCLKLESTDVTFTGITPLHATVNWAHPNVTNFQVQIVPQGAAPTATGNTVNGNTFTFNDLIGNTSYDVYIKTVCDSETASAWAGPFNFRTSVYGLSCATPIIVTASSGSPYSLDANLMDFPNADTVLYPNQGSNCLSSTTTGNYLLGNKIFLSYTADQDGVISLSQKTLPWTSGTQCWGNSISGVFIYEDCSAVGIECLAGLNTTATNQPKTIENFSVTAGTTYIIVISSTYSGTAASICFEFDLSFTTCPAPSKFKYKNLLQESVTFSWDNPVNMASAWEYVVLPTTDPAPTGAGTFTAINENVSIGGLTAGTSYNLYIRSICGGIAGGWSAPYTFTTQCAIFETPYSTGFEGRNATNPEPCWTSIDLNGDGVKWSYLGGWEDGYLGYATLQTNTNQNFNKDYIVSPQVNFTGGQKRLRYAHQISGGTSSSYSIKISTTGIGEENFTYVLVPERVITNTVWQEVIYNIPETITGTVNIAWVVSPLGSGQNTTRISITNVYIEDKPICPDPILPVLATGSITTTSAQFSWTTGDVETQWEVIAIPVNDEEPTATTSGIITNSNPYTFTDLNPASRYKFYVRAYCSTEHQSNWVGPVNFITECIVFPIPFYESFNNLDNTTKKFCWTINNANSDGASWIMNADSPTIQGSTSWFNPTSSYNDWLISPAISGVGVKELRYSYKAVFSMFHLVSRYGLQIMISHTDTNPASFTELVPLEEFTNTDFLEKSVYFNANGTFYIAFRVPPHFSIPPGTSILNLDDVYIIDAPECPKPRTLVAQNILSNSANLSWNAGFEETQWEIANQIVGSGVPNSGTIVNTVNYSATLLNSGTIYEFYVRSVCGTDSVSEWVGPFTYTTLCDPFTTPFVETFNTTSTSKDCWRVLNVNNDDFTFVRNVTTGTYEGDYAIGMFTGSNGANDDYLISPTITVTENQRLKFYYRVNSKWFVEDLRVLLSTTGIEPNAFTTVLFDSEVSTLTINNEEYLEMILNIPSGITGNVNFAWHIPTMPGGPQGFRGQILIIDKVTVENIPVCPVPYNVAVSNITDTTVTVNWEVAGNESAWEVVVQPHGEVAPTATSNPLYTHTATAHPFVVNDLDPAIQYDVFVRAVCGSENQWVGPQVFNTLCSFENLCEYTVTLHSGATNYMGVGGGINVMQNGVLVQTLEFPTGAWYDTMEPVDFILYLCNGVEFSLYWDAVGTAPGEYPDAYVKVTNSDGIEVWISELGIGTPRTVIHTGITSCGVITCQQPTDLTVNELSELSWTAGGIETQWEVAIQPYRNGTLPQIGTLVTTPSYTPSSLDFTGNSNVYEFFVKAICAEGNGSFWSGPYAFVINDDKSNAQVLQTNTDGECNVSSIVSFNHSLVSSDVMSCSGINGGDVWYEFVATSKTHLIELNSFEGDYYYEAGGEPHAKASLVLYKELGNGDLEEMVCSYNNVIATLYSTELVEGATYKIRVVLNETYNSTRTFNICIKTIVDPCNFAGINGGFEDPEVSIGLLNNMISQNVIPGWRYNLYGYWSNGAIFYLDALNTIGLTPYEGGSLIQMFSSDDEHVLDLNNIDGLYQDFDSSEISQFKYSFAHASRTGGNNLKLYAGTPGGTFTEVHSSTVSTMGWQLNEGVYNVPANQPITRFVFRAESGAIGTLLDGISISDNNKVQILTDNQVVGCGEFVELESVGTGTWSADENNPGVVTISNASSNTIQINDFITPGEYTFYWKSRYCSDSVVVTYNGFEDVPTVVTPVQYCLNNVAEPLTATASTGYTLLYFTEEVGGTGETTITPSTALTGTTTYYVANVSDTGCVGQRVAIEVVVNELTPQVATFNYNASAYCSMGSNPTISLSEGFATGGEFQVSPTIGLLVDSATGAIDLTNSVAGEYNITYTLLANGCNDAASHSETITITEATAVTTTFTYATPVCKLQTGLSPTLDGSAATGGRFTSTTLTIDEATGVITGVVTPGTHTIRYEVLANPANCTLGGSSEFEIVVNDAITPVVVFTYNTSYCTLEANPRPELAANFTNGGTFSGNNGLPIDATTGAINLATATPGVYGVTYAITENIENCIVADSHTVQVVINAATPSVTDFSYANACAMSTSQMPQLDVNFTSGGSFSSSGIEVNPVTGQVNLAGVATGTYSITYSVNQNVAACTTAGEYTATITVTEGQTTVTGFSYESEYCSNASNDLPTTVAGFDFSGRFEGTPGLVIDTQTGEINFAASTLGNHIVTYTVDANEVLCVLGNSSSATISIVSGESIVVADRCEGNAYVLLVNGSANYTWTDANNTVVGTGNSFNVKEFLNENSSVSLPFTVHVSADGNACMSTGMFTITSIPCLDIPRGISPNGDGLNDAFDLRGMNVRSVVIFNRYGTEVYKFNGNYTNQWYGQTNNDNELPAATYFYSITKADGSSVTGWVYINR